MQRRKLALIERETHSVLESRDAKLRGFYYLWREIWYRLDGTRVESGDTGHAALLDGLDRVRRLNDGHWRARKANSSYYWIPSVEACLVIETPASTRSTTRTRLLMELSEAARQGQTRYDAEHDYLTGLWNRRTFERESLAQIQSLADTKATVEPYQATSEKQVVVLSVDIDHFKQINDSYGHQYGDLVLNCFARRLQRLVEVFGAAEHVTALCGRPGGEEFSVLVAGSLKRERLEALAQEFGCELGLPSAPARDLTASVGVSSPASPSTGPSVATLSRLVREADKAVYRAKRGGRNTHRFFGDIRDKHGTVIDRHAATGFVCIDIGHSVGVRKGDELRVFHPDFVGGVQLSVSDGRTSRVLGKRPREYSGRLVVFHVEDEISHCKIIEEAPPDVIQRDCLLEYVPLSTVTQLLHRGDGDAPDSPGGRLTSYLGTSLLEQKECCAVVASIIDAESIERRIGTSRVNQAMAGLHAVLSGLGREMRIEALDSWTFGLVVVRAGEAFDAEFVRRGLLTGISGSVEREVRVAIGVAVALRQWDSPPTWAPDLNGSAAVEHAAFAMELSRKRGSEAEVFGAGTGQELLYESRKRGHYDVALADYQRLVGIGLSDPMLHNQAGLCYLERPERSLEAAEALLRVAVRMDPAAEFYRCNLGLVLRLLGRVDEAATEFLSMPDAVYSTAPQYLLHAGAALIVSGASSGDQGRRSRGADLLSAATGNEQLSQEERAEIQDLLVRFGVEAGST